MYSVPIIQPDLRHEETIIQTANALDYLQKTIQDVFNRIDQRIDKNNSKVDEIKSRMDVAKNKINSLVGVNKAIKILLPSKFPASNVFRDIPQTFDDCNEKCETFSLNKEYTVQSSHDSHKNIQDKLEFYHVRHATAKTKSRMFRFLDHKQGLGCVPSNITSINSLLLYNTSENIYESYKQTDSPAKLNETSNKISINSSGYDKLEAPPLSLTNRQLNERKFNDGLFYTPKLNDAPEIDGPIDLPDLPGIADDISFQSLETDKIAPSLYIANLPDLPEPSEIINQEPVAIEENRKDGEKTKIVEKSPIPPPPPMPAPEILNAPPAQVDNHTIKNLVFVPLPPPPPPPPTYQNDASSEIVSRKLPSTKIPANADARTNLMEAIRKAGGASGGKLRAAAEVVAPMDQEAKSTLVKPSGDLMADLHNKLSMRRKGISGAKEGETNNGAVPSGGVMGRISAMIPPPPKPQIHSSSSDGSDTGEWNE